MAPSSVKQCLLRGSRSRPLLFERVSRGRYHSFEEPPLLRRLDLPTPSHDGIFGTSHVSIYDRNIYDGHYALPQTLVMHG